ncbi:MAG: glycosyltransferase family 9 protein [Gemmatimonadetes bacterium]|nr:glycosyltransferase family 9 protein [Gemmatimonadota bacterium]
MTQEAPVESRIADQERAVVIVRGGALGDHVLTLPAIAALRRAYPNAPLGWIGHPSRGRLARPDFLADADGRVGTALYREGPDMLPEWLLGAQRVVVYAPDPRQLVARLRPVCDGHVTGWDPRPPSSGSLHVTAHLAAAMNAPMPAEQSVPPAKAGMPPETNTLTPRFCPTDSERDNARQQWADLGIAPTRVVLLHAGSGGDAKCWPPDGFLAIGQALEEAGWTIALLSGPVEAERSHRYTDLARRWPSIGADDPVELAALLAPVRCLIGNDSGPGHLAAAVGVSTLSLFGPTDPHVWCPRGPDSHVVQSPTGHMVDLSVGAVGDASLSVLQV